MNLITSVFFTIIGGLVAGVIGYFATIVSLREQRKQRHLDEHKNNLKAVKKALDQVLAEAWLFVSGTDQLKLPKPQFGDEKSIANIEIMSEPIIMDISNPFSGGPPIVQFGINTKLYDDIPAHFPHLYKLLKQTEQEVRDKGPVALRLLNELSSLIYRKMEMSGIDFPYSDGSRILFKKFRDLNNGMVETDYAGSIFLMVLDQEEDSWPNKARWLKINNIYEVLNELAEEIRKEFGDNLNQLLELRNNISRQIEETKEEIERINLTTRLRGRCQYL